MPAPGLLGDPVGGVPAPGLLGDPVGGVDLPGAGSEPPPVEGVAPGRHLASGQQRGPQVGLGWALSSAKHKRHVPSRLMNLQSCVTVGVSTAELTYDPVKTRILEQSCGVLKFNFEGGRGEGGGRTHTALRLPTADLVFQSCGK